MHKDKTFESHSVSLLRFILWRWVLTFLKWNADLCPSAGAGEGDAGIRHRAHEEKPKRLRPNTPFVLPRGPAVEGTRRIFFTFLTFPKWSTCVLFFFFFFLFRWLNCFLPFCVSCLFWAPRHFDLFCYHIAEMPFILQHRSCHNL